MNEQIVVAGDQGVNKVDVSRYNELVVIHVSHPQAYLPFEAIGAVSIATKMMAHAVEIDRGAAELTLQTAMWLIDHVYEVRADLKPMGTATKYELIDRHRRTLINRIEVMLNSMRERKTTSNRGLAKQVVEACLKEVFI